MADDKAQASTEESSNQSKPKRGRKRKTEVEASVDVTSLANSSVEISNAVNAEAIETNDTIEGLLIEEMLSEDLNLSTSEPSNAIDALSPAIEEEQPPSEMPAKYASGCGDVLKAAREAQGLSIQEVCKHLRLSATQIQAIEQDDFAHLPQKTIVRGFIRNYARLLKIDAAPILLAYQARVPDDTPLALSVKSNASESVIQSHSEHIRPGRILNLLLFLLAVLTMAYFYSHHIKPDALKKPTQALDAAGIENSPMENAPITVTTNEKPETTTVKESSPAVESNPTQAPVAESSTAPAAVTEASATATPSTMSIASVNSPSTPALNNPPQPPNTPAPTSLPTSSLAVAAEASTTAKPSSELGKTQLNFKVSGESWVRVEDSKGNKIFSQVMGAGSEQLLNANKPLHIIVGNASVTQLTIDNQPYDLTQTARGHVAHVQLK